MLRGGEGAGVLWAELAPPSPGNALLGVYRVQTVYLDHSHSSQHPCHPRVTFFFHRIDCGKKSRSPHWALQSYPSPEPRGPQYSLRV